MTTVAIIPARGGSERIPRKNIKDFLGRPMISYPIGVLKECGLFDRIIVSTEDEEIAEVATQLGAEVPFTRPIELADAHTGSGEVIVHAVDWLINHNQRPDFVCCAYATTPFLSSRYLKKGWEAIHSGKRIAFAVTSFSFPIQRSVKLRDNGSLEPFFPEYMPCRSQDLEPSYHDAGQFYWWDTDAIYDGSSIYADEGAAIVLPRYLVQDIDDDEDWQRAELMYRTLQMSGSQF